MTETPLKLLPTDMMPDHFIDLYGSIYEHSPWIAKRVLENRDIERLDTVESLHRAMQQVVDTASYDQKIILIQAHPDLACTPEKRDKLTHESQNEQSKAGLDHCTEQEFASFQELNRRYRDKFGFPFIIAVRGLNRREILDIFKKRVENNREAEFESALAEIHKIANGRLMAMGKTTDE